MRNFFRWLIGAGDDFNFERDFKELIKATPAAELHKPTPTSEEEKWPTRRSASRTDVYNPSTATRKPKAPKRVANARPSAKSTIHKSRL
jgi:hypothetical protein